MGRLLYLKLRRLLQNKFAKNGKETSKRKCQEAAQKAVERDRVQKVLNQLDESWREYLDAMLLASSRSQIFQQLQPGIQGKKKEKKRAAKTLKKSVSYQSFDLRGSD